MLLIQLASSTINIGIILLWATMDPSIRSIPLHLATFSIISASPFNTPLYIHSYTGVQDELRYAQLAWASLDVFEERG
jgi:trafficking protein particle complex subunit 2